MKATPTDLEREHVRSTLAAIVARDNGILNPRAVLDEARDPENCLHRYFEWDDARAGEAYRLAQVGALVRHVKLTIFRPATETRELTISTTRAFQSRPSQRSKAGGYEPLAAILGDEAKRAELLAQVLRELAAYRSRYAQLSELDVVWLDIDEAQRTYSAPATAPAGDEPRPGAAG